MLSKGEDSEVEWNLHSDPGVRAVAIECLTRGWPRHDSLKRVLAAARKSLHPVLRLAAIAGRVEREGRTEKDRRELFFLGSFEAGLDYSLHDRVADVIVQGWNGSTEVKHECFRAIGRPRDRLAIDKKIAEVVLLKGFPQDEEVAKYFADQLNLNHFHPSYTFTLDEEKFFQILSKNFKGNPILVSAVEHYLKREYGKGFLYNFEAALIGNTPNIKILLLAALDKYPHLVAPVLLKAWGMQDEEVGHKLMSVALGPAADASLIGEQIPLVIGNNKGARRRLLELLSDPECRDTSAVLSGLISLGNTQGDTEVVDLIIKNKQENERIYEASRLIEGYSFDPRVRELAKREFQDVFGSLEVIASVYGDDPEIRKLLIKAVTPLPPTLRMLIVTRLGEGTADDDFTLSFLKVYNHDYDYHVKVQASISYHERLRDSGRSTDAAIDALKRDITGFKLDNGATQQAAFCGLVTLRRLDIMKDAQIERTDLGDRRIRVPISELSENATIPFIKVLLQSWAYVRDFFGEEFWFRFSSYPPSIDLRPIWKELCAFADEYSLPRSEAVAFLESNKSDKEMLDMNVLGFLDRAMPKSKLLLDYCKLAFEQPSGNHSYISDEARFATELLGKHFAEDRDVLAWLMNLTARQGDALPSVIQEKLILALCEGWVESEEFGRMCHSLAENGQPLTWSTFFYLSSRVTPTDKLFESLIDYLPRVERSEHLRYEVIARPLARRLKKDNELLELLVARLKATPTLSEKASVPRLIALAKGAGEVRQWCIEELERQTSGNTFPEVGVDLIDRELRPVAHSLLEILS